MIYRPIPESWAKPLQKNVLKGFYKCGTPTPPHLCITNDDFKIITDNKLNMEEAQRQLLKMLEDQNKDYLKAQ